ncbi:MAG: hypothetical protein AABZ53_04285 [Planctomycetota bacterium]
MFNLVGPEHSRLPTDPGALARRQHSDWLTWAMKSENRFPRIPLREVAAGGFDPMLARPHGRRRADRWWELALRRVFGPWL